MFDYRKRNINLRHYTGDHACSRKGGFLGWIDSEKGQGWSVSQQSHSDNFMLCTRYNPHQLLRKETKWSSTKTMQLLQWSYESFAHPTYLQIYPPVTILCFQPNLKKWLGGQRFGSNNYIMFQTPILETSRNLFIIWTVSKLEKSLMKCMELKVDYFEKWNGFSSKYPCFL